MKWMCGQTIITGGNMRYCGGQSSRWPLSGCVEVQSAGKCDCGVVKAGGWN
jgi:hypothetical protein